MLQAIRAVYQVDDARVGVWSQPVSIAVQAELKSSRKHRRPPAMAAAFFLI